MVKKIIVAFFVISYYSSCYPDNKNKAIQDYKRDNIFQKDSIMFRAYNTNMNRVERLDISVPRIDNASRSQLSKYPSVRLEILLSEFPDYTNLETKNLSISFNSMDTLKLGKDTILLRCYSLVLKGSGYGEMFWYDNHGEIVIRRVFGGYTFISERFLKINNMNNEEALKILIFER